MKNNIRGLKCSLDHYDLVRLLKYLSQKEWRFFAPWCLLEDHRIITDAIDFLNDFSLFENHNIWELELQCIPDCTYPSKVQTYHDFCNMPCICYLLYYDCGYLELYIKENDDFQQLRECLGNIGAQDLSLITDETDTRTEFSVG